MFNQIARTLAVIPLALLSLSAAAQTLPPAIRSADRPTAEQRQEIAAFVDAHASALAGGDSVAMGKAREALLAPLVATNPSPSVAFRLAMQDALLPKLRPLVSGEDEQAAFNAIRLAGALGAEDGAKLVVGALDDERPSVRYAAAFALRGLLQDISNGRAPLPADRASDAVQAVARALEGETNRGVIEGYIAAMGIARSAAPGSNPVTLLCSSLSRQIQAGAADAESVAAAPGWAETYLRALRTAQTAALEQLRTGRLDRDFGVAAAELAGHTLAHISRRVAVLNDSPLAQEEWERLADLAGAAEATLTLIHGNLVPSETIEGSPIRNAMEAERSGEDGVFAEAAGAWIGAQGRLTGDPYDIPADRFGLR